MVWAIVCLLAGVVAEQTGPDVFPIYLTALSVAAVALLFVIAPERMPGGVGQGSKGRDEGSAR